MDLKAGRAVIKKTKPKSVNASPTIRAERMAEDFIAGNPFDNPIGRTLTAEFLRAGKTVPDCAMRHFPAPEGALEKAGRSATKRVDPKTTPHQSSPARSKAVRKAGPKVRTHPGYDR